MLVHWENQILKQKKSFWKKLTILKSFSGGPLGDIKDVSKKIKNEDIEQSHSAKKKAKAWTFIDFSTYILLQNTKKVEGGELKMFL